MNKTRVVALIVIILVIAGGYYQMTLNRATGSEEQQIAAAIQRAESGVERSDARMAMSVVSRDYEDDMGMTYPVLRIRAKDALDSPAKLDVTLTNNAISTDGKEGALQTHVRVVDRRGDEVIFEHDLTIRLRKETIRKYLIFHAREWRIVNVQGMGSIVDM